LLGQRKFSLFIRTREKGKGRRKASLTELLETRIIDKVNLSEWAETNLRVENLEFCFDLSESNPVSLSLGNLVPKHFMLEK
jgi:hypothetical protein